MITKPIGWMEETVSVITCLIERLHFSAIPFSITLTDSFESSPPSSFLFGLQSIRLTIPSARFSREAAYIEISKLIFWGRFNPRPIILRHHSCNQSVNPYSQQESFRQSWRQPTKFKNVLHHFISLRAGFREILFYSLHPRKFVYLHGN